MRTKKSRRPSSRKLDLRVWPRIWRPVECRESLKMRKTRTSRTTRMKASEIPFWFVVWSARAHNNKTSSPIVFCRYRHFGYLASPKLYRDGGKFRVFDLRMLFLHQPQIQGLFGCGGNVETARIDTPYKKLSSLHNTNRPARKNGTLFQLRVQYKEV